MTDVALDFGTSNTVVACSNQTTGRAETIEVPGVSSKLTYRITPDGAEHSVWVVPSVIHYSETETLIGDQVVSRGLAEHPSTFRWMKRSIALASTKKKKTAQGFKSAAEAGEDFLTRVLTYPSDRLSLEKDAFTLTAPVEAFETYQDWLLRICDKLRIQRVRLLDEPTAAIFGVHGATRKDERFLVFDFGGGTLDVAVVRIDMTAQNDVRAIQLGHAGGDLGGMNIDLWLAEDFCTRHELDDHDKRELEALILRQAEATKIELSDPNTDESEMQLLHTLGRAPRLLRTTYTRRCKACDHGQAAANSSRDSACFGCLLIGRQFLRQVKEKVDAALENALLKAGTRRADLTRVVVTGGTSLIPCVRRYLETEFQGVVEYDHPFDTVVRGACRGLVAPILRHDYAIEGHNPTTRQNEFQPLFSVGEEYPTPPERAVKFWIKGSIEGQAKVGLKVFEVSQARRRTVELGLVDREGVLRADSTVQTNRQYVCLNADNPTFIVADPPLKLDGDQKRFHATFWVDDNRRLLVTVVDHRGKLEPILREHPVVRL